MLHYPPHAGRARQGKKPWFLDSSPPSRLPTQPWPQAVQAKVRGISPAYVPRGTGARFVIVLTAVCTPAPCNTPFLLRQGGQGECPIDGRLRAVQESPNPPGWRVGVRAGDPPPSTRLSRPAPGRLKLHIPLRFAFRSVSSWHLCRLSICACPSRLFVGDGTQLHFVCGKLPPSTVAGTGIQ